MRSRRDWRRERTYPRWGCRSRSSRHGAAFLNEIWIAFRDAKEPDGKFDRWMTDVAGKGSCRALVFGPDVLLQRARGLCPVCCLILNSATPFSNAVVAKPAP